MKTVVFGGKPKTLTYDEFKAEVLRRRSEIPAEKAKATAKTPQ